MRSMANIASTVLQQIFPYVLIFESNFKFTQKLPHAFNIQYTLPYVLPHRANVASELLDAAPKQAPALEHKLSAASSADSRPGESSRRAGDYTAVPFVCS